MEAPSRFHQFDQVKDFLAAAGPNFFPRSERLAGSIGRWPSSNECKIIFVKSPTSIIRFPTFLVGVSIAPYLLASAASSDGIR